MTARWEEIQAGNEPKPLIFGPITKTDIVRYQGASGDMNPIHHDDDFATEAGYPAPLVVGMLPAGILNTWATNWLGPKNIRRTQIRWKAQVWPGDVLNCSGQVAKKYEEDGIKKVDLELWCKRQDEVVLQVWSTFVVPE